VNEKALFFPLFFVGLWLAITTILSLLSGWIPLMTRYPNRPDEQPALRIRYQSGMMGLWVNMRGILSLSVCSSGLRIGMMRLFGPFSRDFFVPWGEIAVVRKTPLFWPLAELRFGNPVVGRLSIPAHVADKLAYAAGDRWPEAGPFQEENRLDLIRRLLTEWAVKTSIAALFFILVPLFVAPPQSRPPILVAILFPAILFGLASIVRFFWQEGRKF
jgi:hypothetical protein